MPPDSILFLTPATHSTVWCIVIYITQRWPYRLVIRLGFLFILKWPYVVSSFQEGPQEFLPPDCHTVHGLFSMAQSLWLACLLALSWFTHSGGSQQPCYEDSRAPRGKAHIVREWGLPIIIKASSEKNSLPPLGLEMTAAPPSSLTGISWETTSQTHPAKLSPVSEFRNCEMMSIYRFKVAPFYDNGVRSDRRLIHHTQESPRGGLPWPKVYALTILKDPAILSTKEVAAIYHHTNKAQERRFP